MQCQSVNYGHNGSRFELHVEKGLLSRLSIAEALPHLYAAMKACRVSYKVRMMLNQWLFGLLGQQTANLPCKENRIIFPHLSDLWIRFSISVL